ncbi:MAG: type II toxin-antitoxin system VapC family toxin [Pseudomonadota bacterium]
MKILLDTCDFLYLISGDSKLSSRALSAILDPLNSVFLSAVSCWEISVKHGLGKLVLPEPPSEFVTKQRELHQIESLSLDELSVEQLSGLPAIHRDPFDRMLTCQTLAHGLTLASSDPLIHQYPVTIL